jgi:hypothetical protein
MGIQLISRVWRKSWGSTSHKMVAIRLADVANNDGTQIVPSILSVASATELSQRQVQRIMKELIKAGVLILVRPGGGRSNPAEYRFDLAAIDRLPYAKHLTKTNRLEPTA